jgi:hypothetical protein
LCSEKCSWIIFCLYKKYTITTVNSRSVHFKYQKNASSSWSNSNINETPAWFSKPFASHVKIGCINITLTWHNLNFCFEMPQAKSESFISNFIPIKKPMILQCIIATLSCIGVTKDALWTKSAEICLIRRDLRWDLTCVIKTTINCYTIEMSVFACWLRQIRDQSPQLIKEAVPTYSAIS